MPTYPRAGVTKLSQLQIDAVADAATSMNAEDTASAALRAEALHQSYLASIFDNANLTVAKAASIFDNANLTASKATSICNDANLTDTKLQSILDDTNLAIQKAQEIVDAMTSPSKIGTGGRRGVIGDDWNDNKLTSRDNAAATATSLDKIFQIFRPEWAKTEGNAGAISVVDGTIKVDSALDSSNDRIVAPSSVNTGTWEWKHRLDAVNTGGDDFGLCPFFTDINNYYHYWIAGYCDYVKFAKMISGGATVIIETAVARDTNWHTMKTTRDSSGNWEIYYDGVSKGTVTDTSLTTANNIAFSVYLGVDEDQYVDDLKVY